METRNFIKIMFLNDVKLQGSLNYNPDFVKAPPFALHKCFALKTELSGFNKK